MPKLPVPSFSSSVYWLAGLLLGIGYGSVGRDLTSGEGGVELDDLGCEDNDEPMRLGFLRRELGMVVKGGYVRATGGNGEEYRERPEQAFAACAAVSRRTGLVIACARGDPCVIHDLVHNSRHQGNTIAVPESCSAGPGQEIGVTSKKHSP